MGICSASSLPWETGRAPVASVNRANSLSWGFIDFLCKPRNISLFLSSIFLCTTFFPYLSLNHSPMPFLLRVPLDPTGAGPRQFFILAEGNESELFLVVIYFPINSGEGFPSIHILSHLLFMDFLMLTILGFLWKD